MTLVKNYSSIIMNNTRSESCTTYTPTVSVVEETVECGGVVSGSYRSVLTRSKETGTQRKLGHDLPPAGSGVAPGTGMCHTRLFPLKQVIWLEDALPSGNFTLISCTVHYGVQCIPTYSTTAENIIWRYNLFTLPVITAQ